jgi:hypothetical protein
MGSIWLGMQRAPGGFGRVVDIGVAKATGAAHETRIAGLAPRTPPLSPRRRRAAIASSPADGAKSPPPEDALARRSRLVVT